MVRGEVCGKEGGREGGAEFAGGTFGGGLVALDGASLHPQSTLGHGQRPSMAKRVNSLAGSTQLRRVIGRDTYSQKP